MKIDKSIANKLPDIMGVCLSIFCALHCIALPALTLFMIAKPGDEHLFHRFLIPVGLVITIFSIYRKRHRNVPKIVNFLLLTGWLIFICFEYLITAHTSFQVIGGLLTTGGHWLSIRFQGQGLALQKRFWA